jgi:hypothetical protein
MADYTDELIGCTLDFQKIIKLLKNGEKGEAFSKLSAMDKSYGSVRRYWDLRDLYLKNM